MMQRRIGAAVLSGVTTLRRLGRWLTTNRADIVRLPRRIGGTVVSTRRHPVEWRAVFGRRGRPSTRSMRETRKRK